MFSAPNYDKVHNCSISKRELESVSVKSKISSKQSSYAGIVFPQIFLRRVNVFFMILKIFILKKYVTLPTLIQEQGHKVEQCKRETLPAFALDSFGAVRLGMRSKVSPLLSNILSTNGSICQARIWIISTEL